MIITDKFIYIHMPKTGGTFVTRVLRQIHEARGDRIIQRRSNESMPLPERVRGLFSTKPIFLMLRHQDDFGTWNQHGCAYQIPEEHRHKPVLTTIRNPYDRYVSQYEYQWWKKRLEMTTDDDALKQQLMADYPHFPDLSFEEFVHISNKYFVIIPVARKFMADTESGRHSMQFIQYFYDDPDTLLSRIDKAYIDDKRYRDDIYPNIHFTFTESLNQDLHKFLLEMGYSPEEIDFIPDHEKIFPRGGGRDKEQKWQKYYTPELKAWVKHRERIIFDMFPHFDI